MMESQILACLATSSKSVQRQQSSLFSSLTSPAETNHCTIVMGRDNKEEL